MPNAHYPHLFSELTIAGKTLRNRVCLTATVTNFARNNQITDAWRNFLIERARGGVGMLVSEVIAVDEQAIAQSSTVTGFDGTNEAAFKAVAADVHQEGALLVGQLWHPGRQQLWHPTRSPAGVSDLPDPYSGTVPHVMTTTEVQRVAQAYVATARRLADCGFDGVELHGAHGYLIMQFLSPASNTRNDTYGGDLQGRTQFAREVAKGIREACGAGFIVGLKMPADEGVPGGIDPHEAERITARLADTGDFDYFAYGQGNFSLSLETHVPDLYFQPGHFIDLHKRMRAAAGNVPVMALGRIGTPDFAEKVVAQGYGDLVGMTRALVTDAAWASKAQQGQAEDIRPCVFDNFCWGEIHQGKPLVEHHNPHLGHAGEAHRLPTAAQQARRITVIGTGPAGMEAAWVAAARGHHVTLIGASDHLGGALALEANLPGRAEMARIIEHQTHLAKRYGVELVLNKHVTGAQDLAAYQPDAIVLATGSIQRLPAAIDGTPQVISARDYAAQCDPSRGELAVLIDEDGSAAVYGVADRLAQHFRKVMIITSRPHIARAVNHCSAIGVYRRLYSAGVELRPARETAGFAQGVLRLVNPYSGQEETIEGVDLLVYATPRVAQDALAAQFTQLAVHLIGDCRSPRNLLAAIQGGYAISEAL
ncbi:MAG: 2,4-dienoyl-CoA reductase-like NADH-dependent reductase (Old Yellow Enzyme family) [Gammaproteobacteria bacterium]|jgi:2,4-dienoyl-CoA reductase-like NADH-dependent reductase (Old Yellow Enzyme family)/thioredoxin reductase